MSIIGLMTWRATGKRVYRSGGSESCRISASMDDAGRPVPGDRAASSSSTCGVVDPVQHVREAVFGRAKSDRTPGVVDFAEAPLVANRLGVIFREHALRALVAPL